MTSRSRRIWIKWRMSVRRWWQEHEWPTVAMLGIAALILGMIGLRKHLSSSEATDLDLLWRTLQLFVLDSGSLEGVDPPMAWELNVSRFLAPLVAMYAAVQALGMIFSEQMKWLRLRRLTDHVIICGLGRKGLYIARGYLELGIRIVIIEKDSNNGRLKQCEEEGAIVLYGNAADENLLRKAKVQSARSLFAVTGDDGTNVLISTIASGLLKERSGQSLSCMVHIHDPLLYRILSEREIENPNAAPFRPQFFNIYDRGSRILLSLYPLFRGTAFDPGRKPCILVAGLSHMGESLLITAARSWSRRYLEKGEKLDVVVIDDCAQEHCETLKRRYAFIESCQLTVLQTDIHSSEFLKAPILKEITTAYVCLDEDASALSAGLAIQEVLKDRKSQVVVCLNEDEGMAPAGKAWRLGWAKNFHVFGLMERACSIDALPGGSHEFIAKAIHEDYVRDQMVKGATPAENKSLMPWDELSLDFRSSNFGKAAFIARQMEVVDCIVEPSLLSRPQDFQFTGGEIEIMAKMEHERWMSERLLQAWSYGERRDDEKKTNPLLVLWDKLSDDVKEGNRKEIRLIPKRLALAGFQIRRI